MIIRITTDTQANALYVHLGQGLHHHSQELPNGMILDWDVDGNVRGVEVLTRLRSVVVDDITNTNPDVASHDLAQPGTLARRAMNRKGRKEQP